MAVYAVIVAKGSEKNFFDGIGNGIWGFTSSKKLSRREQKKPEIGDLIVFGFALHQNSEETKGGFPRISSLDQFLYHYKPYVEFLTIGEIIEINTEEDHSKVTDHEGNEIWLHKDSALDKHKYPYRLKLRVIQTYDKFDFIKDELNPQVAEAFRLSASDIGSLRFASPSDAIFSPKKNQTTSELSSLSRVPKATTKLIPIEANSKMEHYKKGVEGLIASKKEAKLVEEYCQYLLDSGHDGIQQRTQITMPNGKHLYTDITINNKLIEAKSSAGRHSIRMAIGQLFDYENLIETDFKKAILLPELPDETLCHLLNKLGFSIIYKTGSTFSEI
ncbi:TPA: hypothetical protein ACS7XF_002381 [Providencia alcalifaciens]